MVFIFLHFFLKVDFFTDGKAGFYIFLKNLISYQNK